MKTLHYKERALANALVLIIRHAEKPNSGVGLSPEGVARANAYVGYFTDYKIGSEPLNLDCLIAAADSDESQRPRLTLEPLSEATHLVINHEFKDKDYAGLVNALQTTKQGERILICWHHEEIPNLLKQLGVGVKAVLPGGKWPGGEYGWVIQVPFDSNGKVLQDQVERIEENLDSGNGHADVILPTVLPEATRRGMVSQPGIPAPRPAAAQEKTTPNPIHVASVQDGLTLKAYRGDRAVMLAFDLDPHLTDNFAGFAVTRTDPGGKVEPLLNRLNFDKPLTQHSTVEDRVWTGSDQAPFQKYRWVDFPQQPIPGDYSYEATAMYFQDDGTLKPGAKTSVVLNIIPADFTRFEMGFTRGYLSSQAYATLFNNKPFRPDDTHELFFDTTPYQNQYQWLGGHAREMIFSFLDECVKNDDYSLDLFAYDLDEPDFVRGLQSLKGRLRAFLDDATLHTKPGAREILAKQALIQSAGEDNIKSGHFHRFAHCKVMIMKDSTGKPIKVLTGSANFSIRGLYVQANNVMIFEDPDTAALYEKAFQQAFSDMAGFARAPVANQWFDVQQSGVPPLSVSFSPHTSADISLGKVAKSIQDADSSVLFAIMELSGSGSVMDRIKSLGQRQGIFSYGVTQSDKGISLYKPGAANGLLVPFSYLSKHVPAPFDKEISGGMGQVIHDKFVVVDFNDTSPVVFTGSSNQAAGGETQNCDNLLAIYDQGIATAYAVEAIRLIDHYHFRQAVSAATDNNPLVLAKGDWWRPYYDENDIRCRERALFIR